MNSSAKTKTTLELLTKRCDDIKYEKKIITNDFESLKEIVKKSGIICLVCGFLQILVVGIFLNSRNASVYALGRFLTPFILVIFLGAFFVFINRGFDFFVNVDTKYSKKLAKKLDRPTVSEKLDDLNNAIMRLELEIKKQEESIYERTSANNYSDNMRSNTLEKREPAANSMNTLFSTTQVENGQTSSESIKAANAYSTINTEDSEDESEDLEIEFIEDFGIEFIDNDEDENKINSTKEAVKKDESSNFMFDMLIKRAEVQERVKVENVQIDSTKVSSGDSGNREGNKESNSVDDILSGLDEIPF